MPSDSYPPEAIAGLTPVAVAEMEAFPPRPRRGLVATCVIAMMLGATGTIYSLFGNVAVARMQDGLAAMSSQGMSKGYCQAQQEIHARAEDIQKRYMNIHTGMLAINASLSVCLLAAGYMTLRLHPHGYSLLLWTFLVAIFAETARVLVQSSLTADSMTVLASMTNDIKTNGFGHNMSDTFAALHAVRNCAMVLTVGVGTVAVLAVAEMLFYFFGLRYLRRPNIQSLFDDTTTA
jgi:hypothetical protein